MVRRALLCSWLLVLLIARWTPLRADGELQLHFVDVGEGDAALLVAPDGETVLFDNGPRQSCDHLVSYIEKLGIKKIDYQVISHYHADHLSCTRAVLNKFPLSNSSLDHGGSATSSVYAAYVHAIGDKRRTAAVGQSITLDAKSPTPTTIRIVAAANSESLQDENDNSVVALIQNGDFKAVMGGDLQGGVRGHEAAVGGDVGKVDVYKVHQHGSRNASSVEWLAATKPTVGIVSVGSENLFGFPSAEALARLHDVRTKTYWTEVGNGARPVEGWDLVSGDIVVAFKPGERSFAVTGGGKTDTYSLSASGAAVNTQAVPKLANAAKLTIGLETPTVAAGKPFDIDIHVQGTGEQPAAFPSNTVVNLAATLPSGTLVRKQITIRSGQSTVRTRLSIDETGISELRVQHPTVLEGSALVRTLSLIQNRSNVAMPAAQRQVLLRVTQPSGLLANGRDAATIVAYLMDTTPAETPIPLRFSVTGGRLVPSETSILPGDNEAKMFLTADTPTVATVEYIGMQPMAGEKLLRVEFGPPIASLRVRPSPPAVSLFRRSEIYVELLRDDGNQVSTRDRREVSLKIEGGNGDVLLDSSTLSIPAGHAETKTEAVPVRLGKVMIAATSPGYSAPAVEMEVRLPIFLLLLTLVGGAIGGVIAASGSEDTRWWARAGIGVVTGFVLYWAFIVGFFQLRITGWLLNPLTAFCISTLGGWLGTKVFDVVANRIGVRLS